MNQLTEIKDTIASQLSPIISPLKGKALDRWDQFNNREQLIVTALGVCFVIVFFIVLIYVPLLNMRGESRMQYESKVKLYTWMNSVAPTVKGVGASAGSPAVRNLMNDINTRASSFQLQLGRVQPEGSNKLRVSIQDASFDAIMRWLAELDSVGIVVNSISFDAESAPGIVTAKVLLQNS